MEQETLTMTTDHYAPAPAEKSICKDLLDVWRKQAA